MKYRKFKVLVVKCSQAGLEWYELVVKHYFLGVCYETNEIDRVYETEKKAYEIAERYHNHIANTYYSKTKRLLIKEYKLE
jgi:hypothetical protein